MMPRFMPWSSSPVPASCMSRKKSTMEWTAVSLCPTPTVSTNILSKPAASQSTMVSRVLRATPPSEPAAGLGRMNALGCTARRSMRVLSPSMLPLVRSELGSMASTASLPPSLRTWSPNASILVLLPAPGTPVIPMRSALPVFGSSPCKTRWALSKSLGALLSIRVIALDNITRLPSPTPFPISSRVGFLRNGTLRTALGS